MNHKFMPARDDARPVKIIHDLNVLSSEGIAFKYKEKVYKLGKLTVGAWMKLIPAYAKVTELQAKLMKGEEVSPDDVIEGYFEITSALIPDLSYPDIRAMEFAELNKILDLIRRKFEGDPTLAEDAQKKNPQFTERKSLSSKFSPRLLSFANTLVGRFRKS